MHGEKKGAREKGLFGSRLSGGFPVKTDVFECVFVVPDVSDLLLNKETLFCSKHIRFH